MSSVDRLNRQGRFEKVTRRLKQSEALIFGYVDSTDMTEAGRRRIVRGPVLSANIDTCIRSFSVVSDCLDAVQSETLRVS